MDVEVEVSYRGTTTRMPVKEAKLLFKHGKGLTRAFANAILGDLVRVEHRDGGTMTIRRPGAQKSRAGDDDNPPSPDDEERPKPRLVSFEIPVAFPLEVTGYAYVMAEDRQQARDIVESYGRGDEETGVLLDFTEASLSDLRHTLNGIKSGHIRTHGGIHVAGEPRVSAQYLLTQS